MYEIGVDSKLDSSVEQRKEMAIAPNKKTNNKVIMVFKKSRQKYEKCACYAMVFQKTGNIPKNADPLPDMEAYSALS